MAHTYEANSQTSCLALAKKTATATATILGIFNLATISQKKIHANILMFPKNPVKS